MKKIIKLTESDLMKIVRRVIQEQNVNNNKPLGPDQLSSMKATITKRRQNFFNKKYNLNLKVDGNWLDKKYNEALARYIVEKKGTPQYCRKGDGYCHDSDVGVVYTTDKRIMNALKTESESNNPSSGYTQK